MQDEEYLYLVMEYLAGGDVMVNPRLPPCISTSLLKFVRIDEVILKVGS